MPIRCIVYDLDDTLLDTSRLIVPRAAKRSCQFLIDAGLSLSLEQCQELRAQMAKKYSHKEIFAKLAAEYGLSSTHPAVEQAIQAFYNPEVPSSLPVFDGALEVLQKLQDKGYSLYLVTSGDPKTQNKKIDVMGVRSWFKQVFIPNSLLHERKENAFRQILALENIQSTELLSFGNRLSSEIRDAKRAGCTTCYFAYGEHLGEQPQFAEDHPDFTISRHEELISQCGL